MPLSQCRHINVTQIPPSYQPCFFIFCTNCTTPRNPSLNRLRQRSFFSLFLFKPAAVLVQDVGGFLVHAVF